MAETPNISTTEKNFCQAFGQNNIDDTPDKNLQINTFSGMCLFGSGDDQAITEDGQVISLVEIGDHAEGIPQQTIVDIDIKPPFSLYEIEKMGRLTAFLNQLKTANQNKYQDAYRIMVQLEGEQMARVRLHLHPMGHGMATGRGNAMGGNVTHVNHQNVNAQNMGGNAPHIKLNEE